MNDLESEADRSRNRRKSLRSIDYSKEQEFSDEDIFEDTLKDEKSIPVREEGPPRRRPGRPRKYDNEDNLIVHTNDDPTENFAYRYVEKGHDMNLPSIRERYTFSPEYEEDGSPKIECIIGRRPIKDKSKLLSFSPIDESNEISGSDEEENKICKKNKNVSLTHKEKSESPESSEINPPFRMEECPGFREYE